MRSIDGEVFPAAAHGQAVLRTTSQALRASSPSRGASGETVHFAGTAKASPTRSNGDDRRQWRKQGVAVGAAASRMQATAQQTLGAATRAVASRSDDGEVVLRQSLSSVGKSGSQHRFLYLFVEVYGILILHPVPAH